MSAAAHVLVFRKHADPAWLVERTRRGLARLGLEPDGVCPAAEVAAALRASAGPIWLLRAGAWPTAPVFEPPLPSATARPLLALGAVVGEGEAAATWRAHGDLERAPLPEALSVWLEASLAAGLAGRFEAGLDVALVRLREDVRPRVVRAGALDVEHDPRVRAAELVTSLQQGGAERVTLELAAALPRQGVGSVLGVLGAPTRDAFPVPPGVALLHPSGAPRAGGWASLDTALAAAGVDVVHAHLLEAEDVRALARAGWPVAVTLHNQRAGWPAGTESMGASDARLLIACSRAVERDAREAGLQIPIRTVRNGVDFGRFAPPAAGGASDLRATLGLASGDFVMLALANPRPQKRLERLVVVLHELRRALQARGSDRQARLVVAGSPSCRSAEAQDASARLSAEARRLGVAEHVRRLGAVEDVASLLRAADVLVSASAHEGLSLAQLEALACDIPVVATDVGGAREVAARVPGLTLVARDAEPAAYLPRLLEIAGSRWCPRLAPAAQAHFSLEHMAAGCARLLRSVTRAAARGRRSGLLLVANNFSTGGAQSSAQRLLLELHARGIPVRAAVLEEQPAYPTPGRRALEAAGVAVLSVPPPADLEPEAAVAQILEWAEAEPPRAVVLWNVIVEHKVLLADSLFDIPVFDVSPGEMYFASLERYFERPRPGLAYSTPAEYGGRLAGVVVKYQAEASRARAVLGARVHVIPNGVAVPDAAPAGSGNGVLRIGTLARLDPRKRLDRLIDALRRAAPGLPAHRLAIAGGPEPGAHGHADELRRRAEGLDVEFVGDVAPGPFLAGLDLFALVAEPAGCPNASLEAMARGLPVVATDAGGMSEQVLDGVTGRLVPREDTAALAQALVELGAAPRLRRRLGAAGRARVQERFSLQRMVDSYLELLLGAS